ncbi:Isoflavone reductase-like protein IRL [Penicillium nucicola]|uniref:Isoflavone reductase-like protein IRL n=1 Tax=Penicillium nucicola TaxID=1850975 RepID=UPI002544D555|nr:Isoflavone reductase-like protein IRL [Penicillium nucicola]KAJ5754137.1 Isoflavone reductase-like protein IRL [Penicillium nucicola]
MAEIKHVLVIGASGNIGRAAIKALLEENFQVTGMTRESSKADFPEGVKHVKSDYSEASLVEAFKGQDAVISTMSSVAPGGALSSQKSLIDAAIAAGVKVFCPSEFGIDSSDPSASTYIPFLVDKIDTLDYLKSQEDKISWTAVITGCMFDWGLNIPGFAGWNIPARTATIFDGGNISFEATNIDQVGKALAKCLVYPKLTQNQYVYVNSFTTTQNEVLKTLEQVTGEKFTTSEGTVDELWNGGAAKVKEGQALGVLDMIAGAVYGKGHLAQYSSTKGLWNEKLGLPQEDVTEFLNKYVAAK